MKRTGIIYKVTSPSYKVYIGQTIKTLVDRKKYHFLYVKRNPRCNAKFANALKKYGNKLKWKILYSGVPPTLLNSMEMLIISLYNSYECGYNGTLGGGGSIGRKVSKHTKNKISKAHLGKKASLETKSKMSKAHKGKPKLKSDEYCINMSIAKLGINANENNPKAKLNRDIASEIRLLKMSGLKTKQIAEKFHISVSTVIDIVMNRRWKDGEYKAPVAKNWKNSSKLTSEQVKKIRNEFKLGIPIRKLSKTYGITRGSISNIIHYRTWRNI